MSLESLCSVSTATIKRNLSTSDTAMGQIRNYTMAARGSLPTTSTGRMVQDGGNRRLAYEMHDLETNAKWYTITDPQVDESDVFVIGSNVYFVQNTSNPDLLNRYYIIDLKLYSRDLQ